MGWPLFLHPHISGKMCLENFITQLTSSVFVSMLSSYIFAKKLKHMKYFALIGLVLIAMTGCRKESRAEKDEAAIQVFLNSHPEINAKRHSSGVYYQIYEPGSGGYPNTFSTVKVEYRGYLTDGTLFDQTSEGQTRTFKLYQLVKGWQIAVPLLQKGGSGLFIIPSELGYGKTESGNVPANSVLVFEIKLVDFN